MKRRVFLKALAVFLVLIIGVMFLQLPALRKLPQAPPPKPAVVMAEKMMKRFKESVHFKEEKPAADPRWFIGTVEGAPAWLDSKTGLVWGPMVANVSFIRFLLPEIERARAACAAQEPAGAWMLPTVDEFDGARAGLTVLDKDAQRRWISYRFADERLVPMARAWGRAGDERIFHLRCVARAK